jgi:hypothetical protein
MLKKAAFCFLALSLVLVSGTALQAQKDDFSIQLPAGSVETLPGDFKLSLPNVADLTDKELEEATQKGCQIEPGTKAPTFCVAWSGANCTGTGVVIPCGFQANGVFGSLSTGCATSYGLIGAQWYRFIGFPDNTCISPNGAVFSAVACTTP